MSADLALWIIWATSWMLAIVHAVTCDPDETLARIVWAPLVISGVMIAWAVIA